MFPVFFVIRLKCVDLHFAKKQSTIANVKNVSKVFDLTPVGIVWSR